MSNDVQRFPLGEATVTIISIGDLRWDQQSALGVPESAWRPRYTAYFEQPLHIPVQFVHIAAPGVSLVVDAGVYDYPASWADTLLIPGYTPPPGLVERLAEIGVQPEGITQVVITHAHTDHFNGATQLRDGRYVPTFPNARHYLSRADWDDPDMREWLADPNGMASHTLGVLHDQGLLELVEGDADLGHGVRLVSAPGETDGHQLVRVESAGLVLYCLGDLYHHPVEVEQPTWMQVGVDVAANERSRAAFTEAALAEDALLIAAHIPGPGRLTRTPEGVAWVTVNV